MILTSKDLLFLPVKTQSGVQLGYVTLFEINVQTFVIERIYVKSFPFLPVKQLIITPSSIISISKKAIIVKDAYARDGAKSMVTI